MRYWASAFLIIALLAGAVGFGTVAGTALNVAQILFFVFLALFIVSLVAGLLGSRRSRP